MYKETPLISPTFFHDFECSYPLSVSSCLSFVSFGRKDGDDDDDEYIPTEQCKKSKNKSWKVSL